MSKIVNGTDYGANTPDEVIRVLEAARLGRYRVHISLGYTTEEKAANGVGSKTVGEDWLEEFQSTGYIGRSTGTSKIPLMVHNARSMGGGAILLDCIVRIRLASGSGRVLYQHPKYHHGKIEIRRSVVPLQLDDGRTLTVEVTRNGEEQARFENMGQARRYVRKLGLQAEIVNNLEAALA